MSTRHPAWDGLLDPDEEIIWQGAPDGKFRYQMEHPISIAIGLGFIAISTPNMPTLLADRNPVIVFPLIFFCIGIYSLIGRQIYETWQRRHTYYTLTTKRAFIGSRDFKGKTLQSYAISADSPIHVKETEPASVYFAREMKRGGSVPRAKNIGFLYIENAREVVGHLRAIQAGDFT